ncbi:MAG TPA: ATP-binding protein [Armatimonadota bacterium]|nr:ATP-binding protein [Armatimonadota bacterium]
MRPRQELVLKMSRPQPVVKGAPVARRLHGVLKSTGADIVAILARLDDGRAVSVDALAGNTGWLQPEHLRWLSRLAHLAVLRGQPVITDRLGTGVDEPAPDGIRTAWFVPIGAGDRVVALLNPSPSLEPRQILDPANSLAGLWGDSGHRRKRTAPPGQKDSTGPWNEKSQERTIFSSEGEAIRKRERKRLAYDLHDGPARRLVECLYHLDAGALKTDPEHSEISDDIRAARAAAQRAMDEMRRLVHRYRTPEEDTQSALLTVIEDFQRLSGAQVTFDCPQALPLQPAQDEALRAVAAEALFNAWRHGSADQIAVTVESRPGEVLLIVADNGKGFDTSSLRLVGEQGSRVGLMGLRERVGESGGCLVIESKPGKGTTVTARFQVKNTLLVDLRRRPNPPAEGEVAV